MLDRTIKVLLVDDDEMQRHLLTHHLGSMNDLRFEIHYAEAEGEALDVFKTIGVEIVILDYNLRQGNGLHCLQTMRRRDPIVPIIAISGVATADIVNDLVQAGADDYFNKRELTSAALARSMRAALTRADAWKNRRSKDRN